MALGDDVTGAAPEVGTTPPAGGMPGAGPGPGPGPGAGPPRAGGAPGGILAALMRQFQGPQVSAPGMGNMAKGLTQLKMATDLLQAALPNLDPGSKQHTDTLKALTSLSRHLAQGAPTAGVQQTQFQDLLRGTTRNALMQRIIGQGQQGGPGGGQQMAQAPAAATPLPGA